MVRGDGGGGAADLLPDAAVRLCALLHEGGLAQGGGDRRSLQGGAALRGADHVGLPSDGIIPNNYTRSA